MRIMMKKQGTGAPVSGLAPVTDGLRLFVDPAQSTISGGTIDDLSGNGLDLSVGSAVSHETDDGGRLYFTGGTSSNLFRTGLGIIGRQAWTKSVWYKPISINTNRRWLMVHGQPGAGAEHWIYTNTTAQWGVWNGSGQQQQSGIPLSSGVWANTTTSFDGSTYRVYANGALLGLYTAPDLNLTEDRFTLAKAEWSETAFDGWIGPIHIYDRSLSDAEVTTLYNGYVNRY